MSFRLPRLFWLSPRSSRYRKSSAIVPTLRRLLQQLLPRLQNSQNRSSRLRDAKLRQQQSHPHHRQRKTRRKPPPRKRLRHSLKLHQQPRQRLPRCAPVHFLPQTRGALPCPLPRAGKSSTKFCPMSPKKHAPPSMASFASVSTFTSIPQATSRRLHSIRAAPASISPISLCRPPAAGSSLHPKWAVTASLVNGLSASISRHQAPKPFPRK